MTGSPHLIREKEWDFSRPHPHFLYKSSFLNKEQRETLLPFFNKSTFENLLISNLKLAVLGLCHSRRDIWKQIPKDFSVLSVGAPPPSLLAELQSRNEKLHVTSWNSDFDFVESLPKFNEPEKLLIYFSNPSNFYGNFLPTHNLNSFLNQLLDRYPKSHIFLDESSSLLSFEGIPVGSIRDDINEDLREQITVLMSSYPMFLPQDEEILLVLGKAISWLKLTSLQDYPPTPQLLAFEKVLQLFFFQDDTFVSNLQNILINLDFVLKNWALALRPFQELGWIKTPHWPQAGYFLSVDVSEWLKLRNMNSASELVKWIHAREPLRFLAGDSWGDPNAMGICFAGMPNYVLAGLKRFHPDHFIASL